MKEDEVILLAKKGTFKGKILNGKIEETHISWVILCKKVVFKIKKPLKLSFLDFSTRSKRKKNCEREVCLNRRFTDIYQDVVPIRLFDGKFCIDGRKGKIIDYAVQLRRLATERRMDKLLKSNQVQEGQIKTLAKTLSKVHNRCPIIKSSFVLSDARQLFSDIGKELKVINKHLGSTHRGIVKACIQASDRFLSRHEKRFHERIQCGFKRDVHGDLHSGNVFIYKTPVVFDCIEFNDSFRRIDVLYEVAFLCMDLEKYGKWHLAEVLLSEYNRKSKCIQIPEDMAIFNYYKGLRANVRVKVHALGVQQAENNRELKFHLKELKAYLTLMSRYIHI